MRLVRELTRQLRGDIETASDIGGTSIVIRFVSHPVPQLDLYNGHRGDGHQAVTIPGKSPQRFA
jgi:hypothetical protein